MEAILAFLFGSLFSLIFWAVYLLLSFAMTVILTKKYDHDVYLTITNKHQSYDIFWDCFVSFLFFIFWPLITAWVIIYHTIRIIFILIGKFARFMFTFVDKSVPDIKINITKDY